jgi:hypothetical protein
MGSESDLNRCSRFVDIIGPALMKRVNYETGDLLEIANAGLAITEYGVVRLCITIKNQRTGDEDYLYTNTVYFDADVYDEEDLIEDLACNLVEDSKVGDEKEYDHKKKKAKALLIKAKVIDKPFRSKAKRGISS